mmetsp:Transcript_2025/g.3116  ORF Transcript_2025/g.3116 Transcript_2025/m.3116 type:complete len:100 (-) Transcript_2025:67-366(-)
MFEMDKKKRTTKKTSDCRVVSCTPHKQHNHHGESKKKGNESWGEISLHGHMTERPPDIHSTLERMKGTMAVHKHHTNNDAHMILVTFSIHVHVQRSFLS